MNGFKDKKDGALVELSLLGNEKAYEELVIRYEKSVKGTALKVTENEFSAEDASQDAFVLEAREEAKMNKENMKCIF